MDDTRSLSNSAARDPAPGARQPRSASGASGGREEATPGGPSEATAPGEAVFAGWALALDDYASALQAYAREVGDAGARALGARWTAALRAAAEPAPAPAPTPAAATLAGRMAESDALEDAARRLGEAARVLLSPDVRAAVATGLSRTFSETLRGLLRRATDAAAAVVAATQAALAAAARAGAELAAGLPVAAIADAYSARDGGPLRGAVATELYLGALACLRTPEARALLEASREGSLGGRPDTPSAAASDTESLAEYHLCQSMCYTPLFAARAVPAEPRQLRGDSGPLFDLAFPQARLAVAYDLAPLVDRRRALAFGPLAPVTSGLNYRLVERLRTISATPVAPAAPAPAPRPASVEGPLFVATAPGSVWEFGPPGDGAWAPFAGAQPRAALYAEAAAAVILDRLRAEREGGWGAALLAQYEAAVREGALPDPPANPDHLVDVLAAEFEKGYDAAPPDDLAAYRDLVVPKAPGPRDYISAAVARLTGEALDARLRAHLVAPRPRVPYAALEREARASQAVLVADVARDLWRRLREAYWGDDEAFVPQPARRKALLLRHFRRLAAAAAATPVYLAPPSLKLWAASGLR